MRKIFLSLSILASVALVSCGNSGESKKVSSEMSARIQRTTADTAMTWSAHPALVKAEIPYARSVRFSGTEYGNTPNSLAIFINNYKGEGVYPIYQGSANQTDSNSAYVTFVGRKYTSIKGELEVIRDNAEMYMGRYSFSGLSMNDTIIVSQGTFSISK
jgi:hypothetical protein